MPKPPPTPKPAPTAADAAEVAAFLAASDRPDEGAALDALFRRATGFTPRLWGTMVGYGQYAYRYDSGTTGLSLATGFAPRKAELSVYLMPGEGEFGPILARLGPHRMGKGCLHLKRLSDADPAVLEELVRGALAHLGTRWPVTA